MLSDRGDILPSPHYETIKAVDNSRDNHRSRWVGRSRKRFSRSNHRTCGVKNLNGSFQRGGEGLNLAEAGFSSRGWEIGDGLLKVKYLPPIDHPKCLVSPDSCSRDQFLLN